VTVDEAGRVLVVGGGLTGVLAAAIRRAQGCDVTLVEGADHLGGLLASSAGPDGTWFDRGTHVPQETGVEAVDAILFAGMDEAPWRDLGPLRAGNVFKGELNPNTPFPDLNLLGVREHAMAVAELLRVRPAAPGSRSCDDELRATYGDTVARSVFAPAMRKLLGCEPAALAPHAHRLFVSRVVALDPDTTRELKRLPHLDAVLAFHSGLEAPSERRAFYPASGGAGRWIADVVHRSLPGVEQRLGATVEAVLTDDTDIVGVRLSTGDLLDVTEVIWTTPAIGYARAADVPLPDGLARPTLRCTQLHHVVFDEELDTGVHYFTVLDEDLALFRATIYQTLRQAGPPSCTLEVMSAEPAEDADAQLERLLGELRSIGVLKASTKVLSRAGEVVRDGFPVMTPEFVEASRQIAELCSSSASNLRLLGRSTGRVFFMNDVLRDCYEQLA
jgi:protoporphyrinogen oxidase